MRRLKVARRCDRIARGIRFVKRVTPRQHGIERLASPKPLACTSTLVSMATLINGYRPFRTVRYASKVLAPPAGRARGTLTTQP